MYLWQSYRSIVLRTPYGEKDIIGSVNAKSEILSTKFSTGHLTVETISNYQNLNNKNKMF